MAKKQHYMTEAERWKLEGMLQAGKSVAWIAQELGFTRQTIYNEIKRGTYMHTIAWYDILGGLTDVGYIGVVDVVVVLVVVGVIDVSVILNVKVVLFMSVDVIGFRGHIIGDIIDIESITIASLHRPLNHIKQLLSNRIAKCIITIGIRLTIIILRSINSSRITNIR